MNHTEEWIDFYRHFMRETDINDELYSDEEVLEYAKGMMVQSLEAFEHLKHEWQYEVFFKTLIRFYPPNKGLSNNVDTSIFKNRAERQTN